jgi:hypothetical protein
MRTRLSARLLILLLLASASSCNFWSKKVTVTFRNFEETVELQQNLVFKFSHDLVDDTLLDLWVDEPYLRISPEVKGKFKWSDNNELIFSPDFRFLPSTDYKIEVTDKLLQHLSKQRGLSIDKEESSISFHTPYLNINKCECFLGQT